jgi:hypothetical protein
VSVPRRYDLPDWSFVNYEVETFNRKLVKLFKNVKVVKVDLEREFYTKHGHHIKNMGKEKVAVKTAQAVSTILLFLKKENRSVSVGKPIRRIREARLQEKRRHSYKKTLKQQY